VHRFCCSVLQCVAVCGASERYVKFSDRRGTLRTEFVAVCRSVLQCVAVCCNVSCVSASCQVF